MGMLHSQSVMQACRSLRATKPIDQRSNAAGRPLIGYPHFSLVLPPVPPAGAILCARIRSRNRWNRELCRDRLLPQLARHAEKFTRCPPKLSLSMMSRNLRRLPWRLSGEPATTLLRSWIRCPASTPWSMRSTSSYSSPVFGFRQGRPMARPWREWRGSSDRVSRFCSLRSERFRSTPRASANSYRGHYPLTNCWRRSAACWTNMRINVAIDPAPLRRQSGR